MATKVRDLATGKALTAVQLSKLISAGEYERLLQGGVIHLYEHTKQGIKEIKLGAMPA
jgi:hypothetical protein